MSARVSIALLTLGLALASPAFASDVGYIYGRVATSDGKTYQGQLRWGTEESFWDDIFNANKRENENLDYVDDDVLRHLRHHKQHGWEYIVGTSEHDFTHLFAIRFGDLKYIHTRGGDDLVVGLRNGEELELRDGSNDVGATITVVDSKSGRYTLPWKRIRTIDFSDTPAKLEDKLGEPIYGTVLSGNLELTGRIQWDNDECLSSDRLDGHTEDGKVSLAFGDIAAIRKHRRGAMVTLKSGSTLYLTGTNDVNGENRGVVVAVPRLGSVKIGWDDFDEVKFSPAPTSGRTYAEYAGARDLKGTVATRDGRYEGRIIFDLDESRDCEMLHGTNGSTEYLIPFRDIARITPKGGRQAVVELKLGLTIELEDSEDVTRKNDGLLVFTGQRKPRYVDWRDVTEVVFSSTAE